MARFVVTVTLAVSLVPPSACGKVAVIVIGPPAATPVALKVVVVAPALIVTEACTVTTATFAELSVTVVLVCCAALKATVSVPVWLF